MKPWPDDVKRQAVAVYAAEGMAAAHEATGVPKGTIKSWADKAKASAPERSDEQTKAATEAHIEQMTRKRWATRSELASTVQFLLTRIRASDSPQKAQSDAISVGILVDKLAVVGWGDQQAATDGPGADLERMREEARKRGRALVAV